MDKPIEVYIQQKIDGTDAKIQTKISKQKKYKETKCDSLQVFLEKSLVQEFKEKVKQNGETQAGVIRGFIKYYLSSQGLKP
jgi:hypothetical protein